MECVRITPGPRYQTVIPKSVREALGLRPGDSLIYMLQDDSVILRRCPSSFTEVMRGLHKELWAAQQVVPGGDPDRWLEEERAAWE